MWSLAPLIPLLWIRIRWIRYKLYDMDEVRQLSVGFCSASFQIRIHMDCGSLDFIVVDPDPMDP
jgi:hypothetical protein